MGHLSPPALLRAWAVRDFYVGASIFSFSSRSGICPDFCGLLLFSNLLSQLEVSALPPALFPRLFRSQSVWRQMLSLQSSEMERYGRDFGIAEAAVPLNQPRGAKEHDVNRD
jgi:hypothetical protein